MPRRSDQMTITDALHRAIELAGLSQTGLARAMDSRPQSVFPLFRGARMPGTPLLERIARATGCAITCDRGQWRVTKKR